ncbi:hypothetical protein BO82DRAFT_31902 [Aspergillus uvarum CBS 121591]|uniref:Uncharacterized protein n=1 Tax=Aspergillus uvarum CBS 121591 TaxID=1448315 RepID=A0A319CLV5_9EURO|nr:hypothetical protein BO82DRAFT_31902 [Aspergillus uvarum CBS 121591]PYH84077.1 hypothetical protein BO82DRAFT_31902 [Aspergillus uvarum CBS 121591]
MKREIIYNIIQSKQLNRQFGQVRYPIDKERKSSYALIIQDDDDYDVNFSRFFFFLSFFLILSHFPPSSQQHSSSSSSSSNSKQQSSRALTVECFGEGAPFGLPSCGWWAGGRGEGEPLLTGFPRLFRGSSGASSSVSDFQAQDFKPLGSTTLSP